MLVYPDIAAVAEVIQLSVAPVFLLAGVGAFLGVLSNRLGRITDRARVLEQRKRHIKDEEQTRLLRRELKILWKRARLTNLAISFCTACALLVCLVIVTLFVGDIVLIKFNLPFAVAGLFMLAMTLLIIGLLSFLREIFLAIKTMRLGVEIIVDDLPSLSKDD